MEYTFNDAIFVEREFYVYVNYIVVFVHRLLDELIGLLTG